MNKYRAKSCYINRETGELLTRRPRRKKNVVRFDSKLEADTYYILRRHFGDKAISVHHPLLVKPKTSRFPRIDWKVDFKVTNQITGNTFFVESKGFVTREFKLKLMFLEYLTPEHFAKTIFVCRDRSPDSKGRLNLDFHTIKGFDSLMSSLSKV